MIWRSSNRHEEVSGSSGLGVPSSRRLMWPWSINDESLKVSIEKTLSCCRKTGPTRAKSSEQCGLRETVAKMTLLVFHRPGVDTKVSPSQRGLVVSSKGDQVKHHGPPHDKLGVEHLRITFDQTHSITAKPPPKPNDTYTISQSYI
jgi:hypothetical protein